MKQDPFRNRYIIKIFSSISIAALNAVIQLFLPRAFSVEQYGYYSYNLNVFSSVVILANLSASNALVSKYSKRNEEIGLLLFYLKLYAIEIAVLSVSVCTFHFFLKEAFTGQTMTIVLLGLEVALIAKFQNDIIGVYDAMAVSRVPAVFQIVLKIAMSIFVLGFYLLGILDLRIFYIGQFVLTVIVVLSLLYLIIRFQRKKYPEIIDHGFKAYLKEYYIFCRPLVVANMAAQLITIIMNWMLMKWSGAVGQAMFGAAWQLNALISYVFSPYAELSKREYAIVSEDKERIRNLYEKSLKMMLWITSYFALFTGFCANWILPVIYGDKYNGAAVVTLLIMIYTIYQAAGQINGSLMIATEQTKMNASLAVIGQLITLVLIFIFQIPNVLWPNGLGPTGIAIVYAAGNFISACIGIIWISQSLELSVRSLLKIQILPVALCSVFAYVLKLLFDMICTKESMFVYIGKIFLGGTIYTVLIAVTIWNRPECIGLSKKNMSDILGVIKRRWNGNKH